MAAYKKHQLLISKAKLHCLSIIISHASHFLTSRVQPTRLSVSLGYEGTVKYLKRSYNLGSAVLKVPQLAYTRRHKFCGASCSNNLYSKLK